MRREFIALIGGAVAVWPVGVGVQQPAHKVYCIGMLETVSATLNATNLDASRKGLGELGYQDGKNHVLAYRSADSGAEWFPSLARADEVIK